MNIALMAHDNRKELMVQFCTAYCGILAKHTLCATARTGQQIADATGLTIHRFLSFAHGGGQQIAARIAYNEIDMVHRQPQEQTVYGLTTGAKSHRIKSNRADLAGVACTPPLQERRAMAGSAPRQGAGQDSERAGMETSTARSPY